MFNTPSIQISQHGFLSLGEYGNERFPECYLRLTSACPLPLRDNARRGADRRGSWISGYPIGYRLAYAPGWALGKRKHTSRYGCNASMYCCIIVSQVPETSFYSDLPRLRLSRVEWCCHDALCSATSAEWASINLILASPFDFCS